MKSEPKPQILTKEIIEIPNEVNDYQGSFNTPQEPTTPQEGGGAHGLNFSSSRVIKRRQSSSSKKCLYVFEELHWPV